MLEASQALVELFSLIQIAKTNLAVAAMAENVAEVENSVPKGYIYVK
jgi:hypothetical protein